MQFCWTTINAKDMDTSLTFYQDIIGLKITRRIKPNPDMEIVFLGEGSTQIELIWNNKNIDISFGKDISLGFVVDSLDTCIEILSKHNISVHSGPYQPNPRMKFLYVLDPNGLKIQFIENT
jgi:lactoylglutathione lyase